MFRVLRMELGISQRQLAKDLQISPGSIYKYENNIMQPGDAILKKVTAYAESHGVDILNEWELIEPKVKEESVMERKSEVTGSNSNHKDKLIRYQELDIHKLRKENVALKDYIKSSQKEVFSDVRPHFSTEISFKFSFHGIQRRFDTLDNYEVLAEVLKISFEDLKNKYLQPGVWISHNEHPVNKLMEKQSLTQIQGLTDKLPSIWDTMREYTTLHCLNTPVTYDFNGELIHTLCYVQADWGLNPIRVRTKSRFLTNA